MVNTYAELFNCDIGNFPIKYLGMPVSYTSLKNSDWEFIVDRYMKWFEAWIGNAAVKPTQPKVRINGKG